MKLNCTQCGIEIPAHCKYICVSTAANGVLIQVGCDHVTPANLEGAIALLGGLNCAAKWFAQWLNGLKCDHQIGGANG